MARCYFYSGELEACERHLERALELCQLFNLIEARGETLEAYGNLYRERGDRRARRDLLRAGGARLRRGRGRPGAPRAARRAGHAQAPVGRAGRGARAARPADRGAPRARRRDGRPDGRAHPRPGAARAGRARGGARRARAGARSFSPPRALLFRGAGVRAVAACDLAAGDEVGVAGAARAGRSIWRPATTTSTGCGGKSRSTRASSRGAGGGRGAAAGRSASSSPRSPRRDAAAVAEPVGRGQAAGRPDDQHARPGRNLPRPAAALRRRRVDDAARARHPVLHRLAAAPPRLQGHDHRHLLGRGRRRQRQEEFSPDRLAHPQGAQQQPAAQAELPALPRRRLHA